MVLGVAVVVILALGVLEEGHIGRNEIPPGGDVVDIETEASPGGGEAVAELVEPISGNALINPIVLDGHAKFTPGGAFVVSPIVGIATTAAYIGVGLGLRALRRRRSGARVR